MSRLIGAPLLPLEKPLPAAIRPLAPVPQQALSSASIEDEEQAFAGEFYRNACR